MNNLLYCELNKMKDEELLDYVQDKINTTDSWKKVHVMVYGVLCSRHGDEKAHDMMTFNQINY